MGVSEYKSEASFFGGIALFIWIILSFIPVYLLGFHFETGRGEHVGYITSVQKQGIFFKTPRAYVKTDISSSQEDEYCVVNDDIVLDDLRTFAESKQRVKIRYFSWFFPGVQNCQNEDDVIWKVEAIEK